jgi:hypothetical protein
VVRGQVDLVHPGLVDQRAERRDDVRSEAVAAQIEPLQPGRAGGQRGSQHPQAAAGHTDVDQVEGADRGVGAQRRGQPGHALVADRVALEPERPHGVVPSQPGGERRHAVRVDQVAAQVERLDVVAGPQRAGDRAGAVGTEAVGAEQQVAHQRRVDSRREDPGRLRRAEALLAEVEPAVGLDRPARELLGPRDRPGVGEPGEQGREVLRVGQSGAGVGDGRAAHRGRVAHQGTLR